MSAPILTALAGYAIGTLQILILDWHRARSRHARELRLLRAELRRARIRSAKFDWTEGEVPPHDSIPEPPTVSTVFESSVSRIDFYLTDEFEGDNSLESLFNLMDGLDQLRRYRDDALKSLEAARIADDGTERHRELRRTFGFANRYDAVLDVILFQIDSTLDDIARRLRAINLLPQIGRKLRRLPSGEPPTPVRVGDPRIADWKDQRSAT